ncbi:MAG: hypothetical protein ACK5IB_07085 [Qingshengfaniella sp.]
MDDLAASEAMIARIVGCLVPLGVNRVTLTLKNIDPSGGQGFSERLFADAMYWLAEEGIIRFEQERQTTQLRMRGCVLTARGYALLGQPLRIEGKTGTVGERVREVQAGDAQYARAGNFFGGLLGAFTKSISG